MLYRYNKYYLWNFTTNFSGPDLPRDVKYAPTVQFEDTFIIVGGYDAEYFDTLIQFDPETESFFIRPERLANPKYDTAVFFVPDGYVVC